MGVCDVNARTGADQEKVVEIRRSVLVFDGPYVFQAQPLTLPRTAKSRLRGPLALIEYKQIKEQS